LTSEKAHVVAMGGVARGIVHLKEGSCYITAFNLVGRGNWNQ
jgi:hypothetical protein